MKKVLAFVLLTQLSFNTFAQTRISNQNQDESKETKEINYWAIKTDLMEFANGTYLLGYERSLNESFTLSAYGGITGKNFLHDLFVKMNLDSKPSEGKFLWKESSSNPNIILNDDNYSHTYHENLEYGLGFALGISPCYYFLKDPSEGGYLGLLAMYKQFTVSASHNGQSIPMSLSRFNMTVNIGQKQPFGDDIFLDYNIGLGAAIVNDPRSVSYFDNSAAIRTERLGLIYWSPIRLHAVFSLTMGFNKY